MFVVNLGNTALPYQESLSQSFCFGFTAFNYIGTFKFGTVTRTGNGRDSRESATLANTRRLGPAPPKFWDPYIHRHGTTKRCPNMDEGLEPHDVTFLWKFQRGNPIPTIENAGFKGRTCLPVPKGRTLAASHGITYSVETCTVTKLREK